MPDLTDGAQRRILLAGLLAGDPENQGKESATTQALADRNDRIAGQILAQNEQRQQRYASPTRQHLADGKGNPLCNGRQPTDGKALSYATHADRATCADCQDKAGFGYLARETRQQETRQGQARSLQQQQERNYQARIAAARQSPSPEPS